MGVGEKKICKKLNPWDVLLCLYVTHTSHNPPVDKSNSLMQGIHTPQSCKHPNKAALAAAT